MKVGMVLYPTFGGSGVVATELGKALAQKGHEIHFITYAQPVRLGSFRENIFYHEVALSDYPLFDYQPYEIQLASKIVDVVKHEKLDLLHVHYAIPHASAAFMATQILKSQGIEIPFITTLHGTDITLVGKDPSFEPVITFCLNESNAVTAVSESLKKSTYEHFNTNREIHVIPNFVPPANKEYLSPCQRSKYATQQEKILCHISNFRPVKRVEDVVKVFQLVNEKVPSKLLLVGDGPDRLLAERTCRALGIEDRVIFTGKIVGTERVLEMCDAFLLPSETESFGLAALEAMAVGVPVISSNTGGIPEVNQHGFSGYLSNVGDVEDMAKNAISMLESDEILAQFKLNAKKRSEEFELSAILPMYEELYEKVVREVNQAQEAI
ncbi:N-acetyl-alpha-D-glucosaminyl L-malate synthase BshA [Crocinitomicaceae bacterium CZZ-1]|uniref:N-acetyl-alpha-D-glucosaminyl L-malate synthase BshA n=1 Tax=Taishania pollutisoli TaxID=2766479 RepID=A0A8J6P7V8_9FLAO|nr:N-acetyl-alpha-D-glucosaminyl L-malate synthase BshA [Taishania pollutisoli]MBC9813397.1 N-acetyl-alpha-D-glucosaminyl L-malate synthase BshA [Taishania pollutisoli]NGF76578.1 N-acetyl-alpha-D-glucosaminyl L-malate synthase BshA [Fluviicola sp. SGL-29]